MSEKTTGERPPGAPSQRALGAMESAVRRAREGAGAPTWPGPVEPDTQPVSVAALTEDPVTPTAPPWSGPQPPWSGPPTTPGRTEDPARREHWLTILVAAVAALVVAGGIALAVTAGGGGQPGPAPAASTAAPGSSAPAHHPVAGHHKARPTASNTTTSTAPATPGGPPVIASLSPASGAAGQGIVVAGSNFLSSSGQIVASFNGQVTATRCPASNTCTVTVPPMNGPGPAQVTITTAGGTSNAVTFTYD